MFLQIFCKKNKYLKEEYETYKQGYKRVDTTIGLVSLVRDYYTIQSLLDDFIKNCGDKDFLQQVVNESDVKGKLENLLKFFKKSSRLHDSAENLER